MKKYSIFIAYPILINVKILIPYLEKNIKNKITKVIQSNMKD
ncbi:hypothetical protein N8950_00460 [Candidatus Pelagibacter sp.]|nr:hypothetical protein [Candidatus Pelagibacter sp.]|tara:strand:- start:345 stop:470 length:126 start_codon:yes stop_codon:yes gene_type:complete